MDKFKNGGGPRTPQGKAVSSKNAIKIGVYTNTFMPGESQQEVDDLVELLNQGHEDNAAQASLLNKLYVQTLLKTNRMQQAEVALIKSHMHLHDSRQEFCRQAGISPIWQDKVPDWYFEDDPAPKDRALQRGNAVREALYLKKNHSLDLSLSARTNLPNLWKEVMGAHAINPKQSLGERLQVIYVKGNPASNLQAFVEDYQTRFHFEMLWTQSSTRYEAIIDNLLAKAVLEISSRSDWLKTHNMLHRQRIDITQTLQNMRKLKALEVAASNVIEVQSATSLTIDAASAVSKGDNVVSQEEHGPQTSSSDER